MLPLNRMKALLIVLVALFATTDARAERVDWSDYLETKSDRDRSLTKVGGSSKTETAAKTKVSKKKAKAGKQKARKGKAKAKRARRR